MIIKTYKAHWTIKYSVTFFLIVLIPFYWKNYGPENFLWLSDISLFVTVFALWLGSPLLNSILLVAVFPFELFWNIDFFYLLISGNELTELTTYMFDQNKSLFLRGLSLFHIFLPLIWLWYLYKWGYDKRAFMYATIMSWIVLVLSYLLTSPEKNINWVFLPEKNDWTWVSPTQWLFLMLIIFPTLIYLPFHYFFNNFLPIKKRKIK